MQQRSKSNAKGIEDGNKSSAETEVWQGHPTVTPRRRKQEVSQDTTPLPLFPEASTAGDGTPGNTPLVPRTLKGRNISAAERISDAEGGRTNHASGVSAEQGLIDVDHLAEDTDPLLDAPSLWDLPFPPWPPSPDVPESANQLPPSMPVLALPISTVEAHTDGAGRDLVEFYGVVPRTRADDPEEERRFRARILMEARRGVIAVDGLYTRKADLHLGPMPQGEIIGRQRWVARKGDVRLEIPLDRIQDEIEAAAQREGVAIADLSTQALLVTAVDVAHMMVGEWAAKIMLGLYEAANDCWRSPLFNLDVNAFLTKLGRKPEVKVDSDGVPREYHRSEARADFWNTMRALSSVSLEVARTIRHPDGTIADDTIERPLVFLFGGTYPTRTTRKAGGVRHHMLKSHSAGTWVSASLMAARAPIMYQRNDFSLVADMPNIMLLASACVVGSCSWHTIDYRRCGKRIRLYHPQRGMCWCLCAVRQHWSAQVLLLPMLHCSAIH